MSRAKTTYNTTPKRAFVITFVVCLIAALPTALQAVSLDIYEQSLLRNVSTYGPWDITTNGDVITVTKKTPVDGIPVSRPNAGKREITYTFSMHFEKHMSGTAHMTQLKKNEKSEAGLKELSKDLATIPHVGRNYKPRGTLERAVVDKFNTLTWAIKKLPTHHDDRIAVTIMPSLYTVVGASAEECASVLDAATSLFDLYPVLKSKRVTPRRAGKAAEGMTLRQALSQTPIPPTKFKNARLGNVLNFINSKLEASMDRRISPVIVTTKLPADKLNSTVTLINTDTKPAAVVLTQLFETYGIKGRPGRNNLQFHLYVPAAPKAAAPRTAPVAPKATKAEPAAPRLKSDTNSEVRRIGEPLTK